MKKYKGFDVLILRDDQVVYRRDDGSVGVDSINYAPTMTQQQFQDECDINNIMKRYTQTGELPVKQRVGQFLDVSNIGSYQEMLHSVMEADQAFMELPADVRKKFDNDPQKMVDFLADESNYDEAVKLGFLDESKVETRKKRSDAGKPAPEKPAQQPSETKPSS